MPESSPISGLIDEMATLGQSREEMTLAEYMKPVRKRGIPAALVFVSLVGMLPLSIIPGFSAIVGAVVALLGVGLLLGREEVSLPRRIGAWHIHAGHIANALEAATPWVAKIERGFRPGATRLAEPPWRNLIGLAVILLAVLLALPIPFTNFPISLASFVLALGLVLRSWVLLAIGWLLAFSLAGAFLLLAEGVMEMVFF